MFQYCFDKMNEYSKTPLKIRGANPRVDFTDPKLRHIQLDCPYHPFSYLTVGKPARTRTLLFISQKYIPVPIRIQKRLLSLPIVWG